MKQLAQSADSQERWNGDPHLGQGEADRLFPSRGGDMKNEVVHSGAGRDREEQREAVKNGDGDWPWAG